LGRDCVRSASVRATCTADHLPSPRAVGMPRSFRAAAIPRNDVIPDCLISPIIGIRSAARALARLTSSALPAARAFADSLAPRSPSSFLPRAFAAARAALVREEISSFECHFMPKSGNSSNSPQLPGSRAGTEFKRARLQQAQASAGKAAQAAQAQIGLGEKMHGASGSQDPPSRCEIWVGSPPDADRLCRALG
jgi:hypothetical protein